MKSTIFSYLKGIFIPFLIMFAPLLVNASNTSDFHNNQLSSKEIKYINSLDKLFSEIDESLWIENSEYPGGPMSPVNGLNGKMFQDSQNNKKIDFDEILKKRIQLKTKLQKLPKSITKEEYKKIIYNRIEQSLVDNCKSEALKHIRQYITFFEDDKLNSRLLVIQGRIYGERGNWSLMERTIKLLKDKPDNVPGELQKEISFLEVERMNILTKEPFNKEIEGIWVSDTVSPKTGIPVFMFSITRDGTEINILKESTIFETALKGCKGATMDTTIVCGRNFYDYSLGGQCLIEDKKVKASFGSKKFKQGSAENAVLLRQLSQRVLSDMSSLIAGGAGSTGQNIAVAAGTAAFVIGANILANREAQSQMWISSWETEIRKVDKNVAQAIIEMTEQRGLSGNIDKVKTNERVYRTTLYKVNPGDEIMFADKNGDPIKLYEGTALNAAYYNFEPIYKLRSKGTKSGLAYKIPLTVIFWPVGLPLLLTGKKKFNILDYNQIQLERLLRLNTNRKNEILMYKYGNK